ncbi:putative RNA recognition motif domain, nucleotide-binding alpha-beta plait domain superfamily [Helianthus annuus]|uniref:RNA recognition motif domain, nucleotide-binding alpha-beta plait domain superfamily n=1 Tax=Helianthus annuus TaxID=4232 RepID=A0A9K3I339_HELAN|nr:putative RNA recognition motif domain, nucleotide-binding alpha-beta plait domain superfamily [Helianthus annuus]KAJ0540956.1 putative RNA recognition motif domain, nucleotide-binding alpha-beta plait domain superfamily [Helianthus annuus]KAJ0886480.1 putative RNA recognition motif domain, nucleotide-binding alpha-beta plait domain superfamily [Helianthus annuus]
MGSYLRGVTKFFVTNLPERSSSKEIGEVFSEFGEVVGVYVARKRDKKGNKFGFVSFNGVKDRKEMEANLKKVRMGSNKLIVNIARFATENKEVNQQPDDRPYQSHGTGVLGNGGCHANGKSSAQFNLLGYSYRDSVLGNTGSSKVEDRVVEVSSFVKPFEDWFGRSLIVRTADLTTLIKLDKLISNPFGPKVSLRYVGGLFMLLVFSNPEEMCAFKDSNPNVKLWFSWMEVWKGQSLPFERIAWLKITGVPFHLAENEVFDSIGRIFGKVVHASKLSEEDKDLSFDLIGVLVGDGSRIEQSVSLVWESKRFKVWISEEMDDWIPDSIGDRSDWSVSGVEEDVRERSKELFNEEAPVHSDGFPEEVPVGQDDHRTVEIPIVEEVEEVERSGNSEGLCMGVHVNEDISAQVPRMGMGGPQSVGNGEKPPSEGGPKKVERLKR